MYYCVDCTTMSNFCLLQCGSTLYNFYCCWCMYDYYLNVIRCCSGHIKTKANTTLSNFFVMREFAKSLIALLSWSNMIRAASWVYTAKKMIRFAIAVNIPSRQMLTDWLIPMENETRDKKNLWGGSTAVMQLCWGYCT